MIYNRETYDDQLMMKYIKKHIPIKAIQITEPFEVYTLEGIMQGKQYDYLVKGIKGELYPVDKEIFEESYEVL